MINFFIKKIKYFLIAIILLSISSCSEVKYEPIVKGNTKVNIPNMSYSTPANNSLFKENVSINYGYQPLFENYRPHNIGDIFTVLLQENFNASNSSSTNIHRDAINSLGMAVTPGQFDPVFGVNINDIRASLDGKGKHHFSGKGQNTAKNTFNGLITVTVQDILPNGNLKVMGEKQVAINEEIEFIRFSGIINPKNVYENNIIVSTQVADAKIEYFNTGRIQETQKIGWLQRLLLQISLF